MATIIQKSYTNDSTGWQNLISDITNFYEWETVTTVSENETHFVNVDGNYISAEKDSSNNMHLYPVNKFGYKNNFKLGYVASLTYITTAKTKAISNMSDWNEDAIFLASGTNQITKTKEEILVLHIPQSTYFLDSSNNLSDVGDSYYYNCTNSSISLTAVPLTHSNSLFVADNLYYLTATTLSTNTLKVNVIIKGKKYYLLGKVLMLDE